MAQQIVKLMQEKLATLAERRQTLVSSNSWTKNAQLKNFAEKLAYETMLLSQLSQALSLSNQSNKHYDSLKLQDLMESHRKMAFLEKKLTNPEFDLDTMAPLEFYTSMLTEKLVVTGDVLSSVTNNNENKTKLKATSKDLQNRLLIRENELARLVTNYKEEKLQEVAVVMVKEFINSEPVDENILMEEVRIREAWNCAHQILMREIVNHQTSQSLLRIAHLLNLKDVSETDTNNSSTLSLTLCSSNAMERFQSAAEESLRQEMEESVLTLSQKYEEVLASYRKGNTSVVCSVTQTIEPLLNEFAGVMAQKSLIDGHLALLQDHDQGIEPRAEESQQAAQEDNKDLMESAGDVLDSEAHLLMFLGGHDSSVESLVKSALSRSEFTFLFNKISYQCSNDATSLLSQILAQKSSSSSIETTLDPLPSTLASSSSSSNKSSLRSLQQQNSPITSDRDQDNGSSLVGEPQQASSQLRAASSLSKILPSPKTRRKVVETRKSRRSSDVTGMTSHISCKQCEELRLEINKLKKKLHSNSSEIRKCSQCPKLLDTIKVTISI